MNGPCVTEEYTAAPVSLRDRVAKFNGIVNRHVENQALNPFSTDTNASGLQKRRFSKEEYGRPQKGSKTECRGLKASMDICGEMLQLCEIINSNAQTIRDPRNRKNQPTKVISFGELFTIYNTVSSNLVGILLRTRKQDLVHFEGEVLFQRRDDDVPIFLLKPIEEIRNILNEKINATRKKLQQNETDLLEDQIRE